MLRLHLVAAYHHESVEEVAYHTSKLALMLAVEVLIECIYNRRLFGFVISVHDLPEKILVQANVHARVLEVGVDALVLEQEGLLAKIYLDSGQFASKRHDRIKKIGVFIAPYLLALYDREQNSIPCEENVASHRDSAAHYRL